MSEYILGINGGHLESSAFLISRSEPARVVSLRGQPMNPHAIQAEDLFHRAESIFAALQTRVASEFSVPLQGSIHRVVASLPGVGLEEEQSESRAKLSKAFGVEVEVVDDTWSGLYAVTAAANGVCAFSGCGASVCIAPGEFRKEKKYKIDGWGPVIGDFGSGFHLVTLFFRKLGRAVDRQLESNIFEAVLEESTKLKIFPLFADLERVQRWYDNFVEYHKSDWRAKFSTLARPILMLADSDRNSPEAEIAREIVSKTASGLAESIEIAASRLGQQSSTMPLILQGGVCRNSRYYREQIIERSAGLFAKTLIADLGPAAGALMLASDGIVDVLDLQNAIRKHVLEGEGAWNRLIQGR